MKQQPFGSSCSIVTNLLTHPVSMKQHLGLQLFYLLLDLPGPGFLGHMCVCVWLHGQGPWLQDSHTTKAGGKSYHALQSVLWACGSRLSLLSPTFLTACPVVPKLQNQLYRGMEETCLTRFHNCRKSSFVTNLSIRLSIQLSVSLPACLCIKSPSGSPSLNTDRC